MLSWFNWHAPVITPAQGAWFFLAVIALDVVVLLAIWLCRGERKADVDPYEAPHGDIPHDVRRRG